jgi:hypothetical protein
VTGTDDPGAQFGGNSNSPIITCSTSIAPQSPERSPTHPAASWNPPQTLPNSTMPIDVSHPFAPGYSPAGWATQRSGPPTNMPAAPPQQSLFSQYDAVPEPEWGPSYATAGIVRSIPIAMTHHELAQMCCDSDRPADLSPPPSYGSIFTGPTGYVHSPMNLPALSRYPPTNASRPPPSLARRHRLASRAVESWLQEVVEPTSASTDPIAQLQQDPASHADIRVDLKDFTPSKESRNPSRDRYTQNKPSIWDKITTGASCAGRFVSGKLPKYRWP